MVWLIYLCVCVCVQVLCVRSSSHGDCYTQPDHSGAILPERLGRALDRLLLHDGMHHMHIWGEFI